MAEKGTGARQGGGGLLGKLLLPGYTDAGPGTTFVPVVAADQMSEAATEICDNRTSAQKVAEHQLQQYVHEDHPFFPSTNATIRQQSQQQQQQLQQNDQASRESPRPQSPPPVSRVQMPTRNVSVTSTAPETGTGRFSPSNLARSNSQMEASVDEDNLQQDLVDNSTAAEIKEASSGGMRFQFDGEDVEVTAWDNAAFRKKVAPGDESGSETGESRNVSHPQLRQQQLPQHHRQWLVAHADDDHGNNETEFRGVSRDNNNMHPLSTALRDSSLFERDSDILSDINSNVSEYGTVINLGGQAARMAEVDAMAALIEASPHFDYYDNENSQSPLNDHPRNPEPDEIVEFGPALPSLESNNENDNLSLVYDLGQRVSSLPRIQFKPQQQTFTSTKKDLDFNSHGLDARADGASAMVSATLRRLGTNRNNVGSTTNNNSAKKKFLQLRTNSHATEQTLSAPPTPGTPSQPPTPRVEDLLKLTLSPKTNGQDPPTIFSLRSPGSAVHPSIPSHQGANQRNDATVINNSTTATALAASFSQRNGRDGNSPFDVDLVRRSAETTAVILDKQEASATTPSRTDHTKQSMASSLGDMLPGPFRFAQKCMSFDSTLDEQNPIPYPVEKMSAFPRASSRSPDRQNRTQHRQLIRLSTSWDVGGPSDFSFTQQDHRSNISRMAASPQRWQKQDAFRAEPTRRAGPVFRSATSQEERDQQQRARLQSDFSPSKTSNAVELQTPQRIEIEREDALDILACLVARGVTLHQDRGKCSFSGGAQDKDKPEDGHDDDCDPDGDSVDGFSRKSKTGSTDAHTSETFSDADIASTVEELRMMSKERQISGEEGDSSRGSHNARMTALDELLRSHAYALEMKRAALSASAWLNSIGRLSTDRPGDSSTSNDQPTTQKANSSSPQQIEAAGGQASGEGSHVMNRSADKMELLSIKAQLHTAQRGAKEKAAVAKKLNEELSNCRAEIGRLRSAYRSEATALSQQDKSILDDHETEESATSAIAEAMDRVNESPSPIPKAGSDVGEQVNVSRTESLFRGLDHEAGQLDALVMKNALDQANEVIQKLHSELSKLTQKSSEAPVVDVPYISSDSQSSDDNPMVNVRMLDGENFVTEWDDLRPPLPPPPDHGLRSPIVDTLLEQWTTDPALHESLLLWMERVMAGHDLESVPPLTISSLDHQVRDGFSMHVLPLLLRRPDIHVSVQARAHRSTMYDLAVTVNPKGQHHTLPHRVTSFIPSNLSHKSDAYANMKAGMRDIDQSSNVTELVTNVSKPGSPSPYKSFPPYRGDADDTFVGPITAAEHSELSEGLGHQQGIMSALGGALGGILSRRKYSASSPTRFSEAGSTMPAGFKAQMDLTSSTVPIHFSKEEELPYHRVVSTPSGRIGVTFVEFRGHAMVSDVAKDSPLSGWVFPSDILIAIDELPVSGMRVRDIVKVLTTRKDRQRALRVISSHAMNEFTNNSRNME